MIIIAAVVRESSKALNDRNWKAIYAKSQVFTPAPCSPTLVLLESTQVSASFGHITNHAAKVVAMYVLSL
jgi:hypothetical protein